jgi:hypothetical protein
MRTTMTARAAVGLAMMSAAGAARLVRVRCTLSVLCVRLFFWRLWLWLRLQRGG